MEWFLAGAALVAALVFVMARHRSPSSAGPARSAVSTPVRAYHSRIAGTSQRNEDGTKRQTLVAALYEGEELALVPEPDNPHDANAIAVLDRRGRQLGYLPAETAKDLRKRFLAENLVATCRVSEITGGTADKPSYGVNIRIEERRRADD